MIKVSLIVAHGLNGAIGKDNDLPWHLSEDLKFFKSKTMGKPMVMGRKTFESFGCRPLPGRPHIIVSRNKDLKFPNAHVTHDLAWGICLAKSLAKTRDLKEVFVIGGGEVYKQALQLSEITTIYRTVVNLSPEADVFFPDVALEDWVVGYREDFVEKDISYYRETLTRRG